MGLSGHHVGLSVSSISIFFAGNTPVQYDLKQSIQLKQQSGISTSRYAFCGIVPSINKIARNHIAIPDKIAVNIFIDNT